MLFFQVSKTAAKGFWIAGGFGAMTSIAVVIWADAIVARECAQPTSGVLNERGWCVFPQPGLSQPASATRSKG